jgi:ribosomal-protein-alanine N-acetyltransferase
VEPALRDLAPADLEQVADIERHTFSDPWSSKAFREALQAASMRALGAFDEAGSLIGYAFAQVAADEGEILNIAVAPAARGRGVGTDILAAMLNRLRREGIRTVYLEVRQSNEAAIRLYRRAGFGVLGSRPEYYRKPREDALTMGLVLSHGVQ